MRKSALLGDRPLEKLGFSRLDAVFHTFSEKKFTQANDRMKEEMVGSALIDLIRAEKNPCFLLPAVLEFIERVDKERLIEHYNFGSFETWLNQFSGLSGEENREIRGKVAGKWIDRSSYQTLFPIGMGKVYPGTHFVTAHKSPDLDTTIASFWGWLDAFAARVGDSLHVWNLPGGPPQSQIEIDWIFRAPLGAAVFSHLPSLRTSLALSGKDLMTQKGVTRVTEEVSITAIDHERENRAFVIVDGDGYYLGDWRGADVEGVQQVILLLSTCLRWFENTLHLQLISQFAKKELQLPDFETHLHNLFTLELSRCEPIQGFSAKQREHTENFVIHVLGLQKGLNCTFDELCVHLAKWGSVPFPDLSQLLKKLHSLFDAQGELVGDRPHIFHFLEEAVRSLHEAIFHIRERLEKIDVALKTKTEVFKHTPTFISLRGDVEEIREKMGSHSHLTVVQPESAQKGKFFPIGVVHGNDIRQPTLGTVSLRDFCNRDEMGIPSYLEVISVIDHHKTALNTFAAPLAIIADVQSSNSLVAERSFAINDRYSLLGQTEEGIDAQISLAQKNSSSESRRLLMRLLQKRQAAQMKGPYFVHPGREYLEYLHFLYGILDDTDLLSKVSSFDIEIVVELLNRLKSIAEQKEVEVISLEDLPRDQTFPKKGANRILQNEEMYSLYRRVYEQREFEVESNVELCFRGEPSNLFDDTKEQNGCCRIGQTKLFVNNVPFFVKHVEAIRLAWLKKAQKVHQEKPEIDLHIHMISTVVSAEEVYKGSEGQYEHKDEMWIWSSGDETAVEHLMQFLGNFKHSSGLKNNPVAVEFLGPNAEELSLIFQDSFSPAPHKKRKSSSVDLPIAVLTYNAGSLNSRKAMVSPFLPNLYRS